MDSLSSRVSKILTFSGPIAAPLTPTTPDGLPNQSPDLIDSYLTYLDSIGVKGLYIHGTTGEGLSIPLDTKKRLLDLWISSVKRVNPDILVIPNVTSTSFADIKDFAQFCQGRDVDGVAILAPFYYRPTTPKELANYVKAVAEVVPDIPLYYYHNPDKTRVDVSITDFVDIAVKTVPSFCGLKFASRNMTELAYLERTYGSTSLTPRVKMFSAPGDTFLSAAIHGVDSANSSLFNLAEGVKAFNVITQVAGGKEDLREVRREQEGLDRLIQRLMKGNYLQNLRNVVQTRIDFEMGDCLPPLRFY